MSFSTAFAMTVMQSTDLDAAAGSPAIQLQPVAVNTSKTFAHRRTATDQSATLSKQKSFNHHRRQRSCSEADTDMISHEEYEALPPSIQRKCFSPAERLNIAKKAASQKRKKLPTKGTWLAPPSPSDLPRPATSSGLCKLSQSPKPCGPVSSLIRLDQEVISQEQARWFLTLPDKIRKQHFSQEDQELLTSRCKGVLKERSLELANQTHPCRVKEPRGELSAQGAVQRSSASSSPVSDRSQSFVSNDTPRRNDENATTELEILRMYSRPDASPAESTGSSSSPRNATPSILTSEPKNVAGIDRTKLKSVHRKISLTPLPLPPPTLSPTVPSLAPVLSPDRSRHLSLSSRLSRPFIEPRTELPKPPVAKKHYHDPKAREQLRKTLESPAKFNDALAFGFSPTDDSMPPSSGSDQSLPVMQPPSSDSENEEDDGLSIESQGPMTPISVSGSQAIVNHPSFDFGFDLPVQQNTLPKTPTSRTDSAGNREMTIHMTLTRHDLRTPADDMYVDQRRFNPNAGTREVDPLALESLPVCDDPTGAHGAFAVQDTASSKGLKRVWKTIRRQRSIL